MALYLKYRPQSLNDLIGQEGVKKTLLSSLANNKLGHAYLFVGPRGTGKTSTARILAKMVNCQKENPPCNKCDVCASITDGSNLDLIEVDAASNRGIDDIRALRETIKLAPTASPKKIYIIDEVHMLTTEAFNALLKTLEEPPAHALFILATTEVQKVPQTILSRVQRLDFKLATSTDLITALKKVSDGEKIKINDEALQILAQKADGSFRDGVKLLEQVSSSGEVKVEDLTALLQSGDFAQSIELIKALSAKDAKAALTLLLKQEEQGLHPKNFILSLMDTLRGLVLIKNGLGAVIKEDYGSQKFQTLTELSQSIQNTNLIKILNTLQDALENLKTASIQTLPLELAIVSICNTEIPITIVSAPVVSAAPNPPAPSVIASYSPELSRRDAAKQSSPTPSKSQETNQTPSSVSETSSVPTNNSPDIVKLQERWTYVLQTVKQYNFSLEALIRNAKVADCNNNLVLLEVPYSFHQRIIEAPKSRDLIESIFSDILGKSIKVSTILGVRPIREEDIANVEIAKDDEVISLAADIFQGKIID